MKGFSQQGDVITYISYDESSLQPSLPPQIYNLEFNPEQGMFYLEIVGKNYPIPELFGEVNNRVERIFKAFKDRPRSTGTLLTGDKGSGKTLFAKVLANRAIEQNIPVIVITRPFSGSSFNQFINAIGECVIIFDEIAKMYKRSSSDHSDTDASDNSKQQTLLSFLDGLSSTTRRLLVFTENREHDIDSLLLNRPGRILFHYRFKKLKEPEITAMCNRLLDDKEKTEAIIDISRFMLTFSYDILNSIIEEVNRNPSLSVPEVVEDMNVDYSADADTIEYFIEKMTYKGIEGTPRTNSCSHGQYCSGRFTIEKKTSKKRGNTLSSPDNESFSHGCSLNEDYLFYEDATSAIFKHDELVIVTRKMPKRRFNINEYLA